MRPKNASGSFHMGQFSTDDVQRDGVHGSQSHLLASRTTSVNDNTYDNNIVRPVRQPNPQRLWKHLTLDTWSGETFVMSFSFLSFLVIVIVLAIYDQKPSPSLKWGLKLNTVISILAIASKSSLMFVVSESIGQLKWIWFRTGKRRLKSLQSFDEASRGPLGSFSLLFTRPNRKSGLVTLGAAITVLALAYEAFMQQIMSYPIRQVDKDTSQASAKRNTMLFHGSDYTQDIMSAVYAGMWTDQFGLNPSCPSGNCTWPPFTSNGWCSQCEDITSQTSLANCADMPNDTDPAEPYEYACNVTVPQGGWSASPIRTGKTDYADSAYIEIPRDIVWKVGSRMRGVFAGVTDPMFVMAYARLNSQPTTPGIETSDPAGGLKVKKATQCAMSPCTRTYSMSVLNGVLDTRVSPPDWGTMVYSDCFDDACWTAEYRSEITNTTSEIPLLFFSALNALDGFSILSMVYNLSDSGPFWTQTGGTSIDITDRLHAFGLETIMHNIAASLTAHLLNKSNETVGGTMSVSEVYVSVEWGWITLPAIVLLSTLILFICTTLGNKKHGLDLWKSAILPVLYHGLDNDLLADGPRYAMVSEMEQTSKVPARLEFSDTKNRLMLRG